MIVLSSATTGRPAASASETSAWIRTGCTLRRPVAEIQPSEVLDPVDPQQGTAGLSLLGSFDDLICRGEHRYLVDAALVCLSSQPQHLARLDVVAVPGPERDADLAALVPDHDPPRRLATFGDVFYLADSAFDSGTASRNHVVHRDHCC